MSGPIVWNGMGKDDFGGIIKEVSGRFQPEKFKRRPFALGTIFAPPKSISLAALAGPRVERVIIKAHRMAVGFVARLLARMLVTRKLGEDVPIRARILRFTHPFSRADDPQFHDHLEWIPDPRDGALHTYPWFFFPAFASSSLVTRSIPFILICLSFKQDLIFEAVLIIFPNNVEGFYCRT